MRFLTSPSSRRFEAVFVGLLLAVSLRAQEPVEEARPLRDGQSGGIVAIVGDTFVTQSELDRQVRFEVQSAPPGYSKPLLDWARLDLQHRELQQLIDQKLILHLVHRIERKEEKPYIAPEQVEAQLRKRVERMRQEGYPVHSVKDLFQLLRRTNGWRAQEYREFLKHQMMEEKYLWREVFPQRVNAFVTPKELREFYLRNQDQFSTPLEVSFRQIFISIKRPDASRAAAAVDDGLAKGVTFDELARRYADDAVNGFPDLAASVRTLTADELESSRPKIRDELKKLRKGETSQRVLTGVGVHYFKVEDVVTGDPQSFDDVQVAIRGDLLDQRRVLARRAFLEEQRRKTRIDIFLPTLPPRPQEPPPEEGAPRAAEPVEPKDP